MNLTRNQLKNVMMMYISNDPPTTSMSIAFMEYQNPTINKEDLVDLIDEYQDNKKAHTFLSDFNEIYTKYKLVK